MHKKTPTSDEFWAHRQRKKTDHVRKKSTFAKQTKARCWDCSSIQRDAGNRKKYREGESSRFSQTSGDYKLELVSTEVRLLTLEYARFLACSFAELSSGCWGCKIRSSCIFVGKAEPWGRRRSDASVQWARTSACTQAGPRVANAGSSGTPRLEAGADSSFASKAFAPQPYSGCK